MASIPPLSTTPVPERAIVLDTETTGFTPKQGHRIVEIAAHELERGVMTGNSFHCYLNPGCHVPAQAVQVHGLDDRFLRDKPRFADVVGDMLAFLGDESTPVWAHNSAFDRRFIEAELAAAGHHLAHQMPCSMKLARQLPTETPDCKLETLAARIGYRWEGRGAHSALEDTKALAAVLTGLLWPLEARKAAEQDAPTGPGPVKVAKSGDVPAKAAPARASLARAADPVRIELPEGFIPLAADLDPRIRRYDELDLDGRLFARGQRWTMPEVQRLVTRFLSDRADIDTLISEHGRSPGALLLKLEGLGIVAPDHPYTRRRDA